MTARVLVGMSIREANAATELQSAAHAAGARLAFLQSAEPALTTALSDLADHGHRRIELVGVALGGLAPGSSWLRRVAGHWSRGRGAGAPTIMVATKLIGPDVVRPGVIDSVLESVRQITGAEAGVTSPAWDHVPNYRHHVLVCRGPRCSARGAEATWSALSDGLARRGMRDSDVLMTSAGCMFPCNQAPVLAVQPDNVWYGGLNAENTDELIDSHLCAGEPLDEARIR